ncbi:MAG: hypothetical protein KBD64_03115 [Gammaproteobacteria bacterium]|nr:hypothetical protein [Gammaproteobacteria bacterium]
MTAKNKATPLRLSRKKTPAKNTKRVAQKVPQTKSRSSSRFKKNQHAHHNNRKTHLLTWQKFKDFLTKCYKTITGDNFSHAQYNRDSVLYPNARAKNNKNSNSSVKSVRHNPKTILKPAKTILKVKKRKITKVNKTSKIKASKTRHKQT